MFENEKLSGQRNNEIRHWNLPQLSKLGYTRFLDSLLGVVRVVSLLLHYVPILESERHRMLKIPWTLSCRGTRISRKDWPRVFA